MKIEPISAHLSSQSAKVQKTTFSYNMAGEFYVSWGIFYEYLEVEISRFPDISEVDLDKMKEGYQNKNTKRRRKSLGGHSR